MQQRVEYNVPLYYNGSIDVPLDADTEAIQQAIEDDLPKYVTIRVPMGIGADADILSIEFTDEEE